LQLPQLYDFKKNHISKAEVIFITTFGIIGLIAFLSPPNNWDSMTYHMSRVMHWIQNRGIEFYPTNILRQLHSNPFAEFVILHFQILSGGEYFANAVQWLSMIGCLIGVSLIAKEFGLTLYGQIVSVIFCVTLPMGILQASSTQNDYVASFHVICFLFFSIKIFKGKHDRLLIYAIGSSLGLAILTKATAYLFIFPFLCWFVSKGIKKLQ